MIRLESVKDMLLRLHTALSGRLIEWGINSHTKMISVGVYLIIFLLPLQTRWIINLEMNVEYWRFSVYGIDVLISVLALVVFVLRGKDRYLFLFNNTFFYFYTFILFYSLTSSLWAIDPGIALFKTAQLFITGLLVLMIMMTSIPVKNLALVFVGSSIVQATFGIWQFFTQSVSSSKWLGVATQTATMLGASVVEAGEGRWLRAYGSLPHPNMLGGLLLVGLLFVVGLFAKNEIKSPSYKIYLLIATIILTSGLFFTFSRSAWLALGAGLLIIIVGARQYFFSVIKLIALSMITFGILTVIYWPLVQTRIDSESRLEQVSMSERVNSYAESWQIIKDHWLLGVGAGNYTSELAKSFPDRPAHALQPVHNVWLLIWVELGIVGVALIASMFVYWIIGVWRCHSREGGNPVTPKADPPRAENKTNIISFIFISPLAALIAISFFDHYLWSLHPGLLLAAFLSGLWLRSAFD